MNLFNLYIFVLLFQENQRPPVYNAEDYVASLKKFSRRTGGGGGVNGTAKSIYDTTEEKAHAMRSATLPAKQSSYKCVIYIEMFFKF